jgi:uncharacterized protein YqeY
MKEAIRATLKDAMKARDQVRLDTIRSILTEIQYEEMQKGIDNLPAQDTLPILQRELKKRQEAIHFSEQANRLDAIDKLKAEIAVIETFMPKQLTAEQLEGIVKEFAASTPGAAMPLAMKFLKEKYAGQYDGKIASEVAKRVLG